MVEEPRRPMEAARLAISRLNPGPTMSLEVVFQRMCEIVAETMNVARVGIWLLVDHQQALRCANLYERERQQHSSGVTLRVADFPIYFAALNRRKAIPAELAANDPRTSELWDVYLKPLGISSLLDAAILLDGEVAGVVCHEHIGPTREWTTEERDFAGSVADLVATKIHVAELTDIKAMLHTRDEQLQETRQLEALGRLAAGVAHDFKNLLTVIHGSAELLQRRPNLTNDDRELVAQILSAADRGENLTRELTQYGRNHARATQVVSAGDAVDKLVPLLKAAAGPTHPIEYSQGTGAGKVFIDPAGLERALLNLVLNAKDAMPTGGPIALAVASTGERNCQPTFACIEVRDRGPGIDPAIRDRLFEPFFTTKGKGTGLGLAVVKQIVDRAGGYVKVESEPGHGTAFQLYLPRVTCV